MRARRRAAAALGLLTLGGLVAGAGLVDLRGSGDDAGAAPTTDAGARLPETAEVSQRDLVTTETVDGTLAYGAARPVKGAGGMVTALAPLGSTVERGGSLWEQDGVAGPVLLYGDRPMWRSLGQGVGDGLDVRQLEDNLAALGWLDPAEADGHWDWWTTDAVQRWQGSRGLERTGTLELGSVVYQPGPVRVAAHVASVGDPAGGPVVEVTDTAQRVDIDLDAELTDLVVVGGPVTVELPTGASAEGVVASVSGVVERSSGQMGQEVTTVAVTVELPGGPVGLEDAPVEVELSRTEAAGATTVPVRALLALAEGGYAVEVVGADGTRQLVAVELGASADGWVAVTGDVAVGDTVVVAP